MMQNGRYEELMGKYADGVSTESERRELLNALEGSEEARARLARLLYHEGVMRQIMAPTASASAQGEAIVCAGRRSDDKRRLWRVAVPLSLAAGAVVAVGVWTWSGREGRVSSVKGEVVARVEKASGECRISNVEHRSLKVGEEVRTGDRIETGKDGAVKLAWVNQPTTLQLGGSSTLDTRLPAVGLAKEGHLTLLFLQRGRLSAVVAKQSGSAGFVVETPRAKIEVAGTQFITSDDGKVTRVHVGEGNVRVTKLEDKSGILLQASQSAVVGGGIELKALASDVKWVDGPIVFQETFTNGLENWDVVQIVNNPPTHRRVLDKNQAAKFAAIVTTDDSGEAVPVLRLDGRTAGAKDPTVTIRSKKPIPSSAFAVEWVWHAENELVAQTNYAGGIEVFEMFRESSLTAEEKAYLRKENIGRGRLSTGWNRYRTEYIPASRPEDGCLLFRAIVNDGVIAAVKIKAKDRRLLFFMRDCCIQFRKILARELIDVRPEHETAGL